jgi:outer membrane protein TolC
MCVRILLAFALCGAGITSGQTTNLTANTRPLALQECIDLALEHNLDLQIEHLSLEIARYDLGASYGVYDPRFTFRASHDYISSPSDFDAAKSNPYFPYNLKTDAAGPELSGLLPIGLSYDISAVSGERAAFTDFNSAPGTATDFFFGVRQTNSYYANTSIRGTQHLLKDFWIDADRERVRLRRKDLKISQAALSFEVMRTVVATEVAYYDLVAARETIRVQEKAVELKQQFAAETRRRVEVGDLPPLDGEQAESQLQSALTALTLAREFQVSRQNALLRLLADDVKTWVEYDLAPTESLRALPVNLNRSDSFLLALKNRPDLAEARLAVEKSDVVVQFHRNQLFPSLDLVGRYGGIGSQGDSTAAMSDALHFRDTQYSYGVVVSFPLSNQAERNNFRASKAAKKVAELQLKKAEQEVLLQVADWVNRVQSRFSQVASTHKARIYAETALGAEQKKLQNGLSTSFVVLELQEALTGARKAEVDALAEYNKAQAQLAFAEGTTLDKHRLAVEFSP